MEDFGLDRLLNQAHKHRMSAREQREQKISFIIGNRAVEGLSLHRGTVTAVVPGNEQVASVTAARVTAADTPRVPFDVNGLLRQFNLVQTLADRHMRGETVIISPALIRELHKASEYGSNPIFGIYRNVPVEVMGSHHVPLPSIHVPEAVEAL